MVGLKLEEDFGTPNLKQASPIELGRKIVLTLKFATSFVYWTNEVAKENWRKKRRQKKNKQMRQEEKVDAVMVLIKGAGSTCS